MMSEVARQPRLPGERPPYLRPVPPARATRSEGSDLREGETERTIAPSFGRSDQQIRSRALTASERRLVRWIEAYVPMKGSPHVDRLSAVRVEDDPVKSGGRFYRAKPFVRRYGAQLVLEALGDMFVYEPDREGRLRWRSWRPEIKSPARMLNYSVKELAEEMLRKGGLP